MNYNLMVFETSQAPQGVLEMIEEMKVDGEYEENKEWLEQDSEKVSLFWTIGVGGKGYYES